MSLSTDQTQVGTRCDTFERVFVILLFDKPLHTSTFQSSMLNIENTTKRTLQKWSKSMVAVQHAWFVTKVYRDYRKTFGRSLSVNFCSWGQTCLRRISTAFQTSQHIVNTRINSLKKLRRFLDKEAIILATVRHPFVYTDLPSRASSSMDFPCFRCPIVCLIQQQMHQTHSQSILNVCKYRTYFERMLNKLWMDLHGWTFIGKQWQFKLM